MKSGRLMIWLLKLQHSLIIAFALVVLPFFQAYSQSIGNEWINHTQYYYKLQVVEEGVYRIPYNVMANAGIPLGTFDPRSFQVFRQGVEQAIFVQNEQSGTFLPGDYIEFYGKANDGLLDENLYKGAENHPNPNYSLFNDTATYFITWNNSLNNKRINLETDVDFDPYTPLPYFYFESLQNYKNAYFAGETNLYGVTDPEYVPTEGWFDNGFNLGQSITKNINTPNCVLSGGTARLRFNLIGASNFRTLTLDHHVRVQFSGHTIDTIFEGYQLLKFDLQIPASGFPTETTPIIFSSINDLGSGADRNTVSFISLIYPRSFALDNISSLRMIVQDGSQGKALLAMNNLNILDSDIAWILDLTNNRKIPVVKQNTVFKALVPNSGGLKNCYLYAESKVKTISSIRPVGGVGSEPGRFKNYASAQNLNSDFIIIAHSLLFTEAEQYASYRNTMGYKSLVADIGELYDQFAYGVNKHPLAIRNFARFTLNTYSQAPKGLFLMGKGIAPNLYRNATAVYKRTLVPSFGNPPSDILFTSGIEDELYTPAIPTGRLSASLPSDVNLYLDKMAQYEQSASQPEEWMKNILHFGGGSSITEQNTLAAYLAGYESILEDTLKGGFVRTFLKSSTAPIQINQSDSLKQLINNGVYMMTFFGHAAGIGFDISIDNPSEYSNYGKYPFLVANSCYAGDIFNTGQNSSEEFVLLENKGTIGYLGSTSSVAPYEINKYSNAFFKNTANTHYGQSVGKCIKEAIREIQSPNIYIKNACLLFVLHGDPVMSLYAPMKPDYVALQENIYFSPKDVSTETDTFSVHVVSLNIGKAIPDSIFIELTHTFPDGSFDRYQTRIGGTLFKDTLTFRIPVNLEKGVGLNTFSVSIDALSQVDELSEINNTAVNTLIVRSYNVTPVYPPEFAIVPGPQVTLKASTGDPFLEPRSYVMQIDTDPNFSNPTETFITQGGGVISWQPSLALQDSMVYFWRVSPVPEENGNHNWRSSSFQHISGKRGWAQAHFKQFESSSYRYVSYVPDLQRFDFVNTVNSITAQTGVYPYIVWTEEYMRINNILISYFSCLSNTGNGVKLAVFNPVNAEYWMSVNQGNNQGQYGNAHCYSYDFGGFDFSTASPEARQKVVNFISIVPEGYYVLCYSHRNHFAQEYEEELYTAFESIGSANIRQMINNTPFIIFGKKGSPIGSANEVIGGSITSIIQLADSIKTNYNTGYVSSPLIGPASEWQDLYWSQQSLETLNTDSVWFSVLGIRKNGQADTLFSAMPSDSVHVPLQGRVDANEYPYLKTIVFMQDDEQRTPAQMKKLQVFYEGIPETAIDPSKHFSFHADTLQEGDSLRFSVAVHNISEYDMDSLLVDYWIVDNQRNIHKLNYPRQKPHPAGDILTDTLVVSSRNFVGNNAMWMEVNPNQDQIEQTHFNNLGQINFYVKKDNKNPVLEVSFDGIHILDGEVVSAKPFIQINLKDENPFLTLNDTSLIKVFLKAPGQNDFDRIFFNKGGFTVMTFHPATVNNNQCKVEFQPDFGEDGVYTLLVQAADASLNESGRIDYEISFEVINKSTITEVLNWPNPFSDKTHFVFTLTGSQLPDYFKIQILTISGKVVKEIEMDELGPLRIGRNITTYAWDGTDQYGDRLANGVYLYRVVSSIDKQQIEQRETSASKYFHHGFGKMYLIR
ncbi:MAG: hypothetical protein GX587_14210 [Bacteroidales bacterium]|nr:hypothetical protein [Bacteroidales bacterium]